ncbi:hypothetical protein Y032_0729g1890 [Ancylostoma ceylanicum]|uniref:Uncharacterized protein n=1 Tax=Ancylostoma ceylanicum TaxID=53326 RepID=A0A016WF45_9BILA|nr:hypothetical protein Y032_0729g1890 [Ancylostoma ceylanicum]
MLQDDRRRWHRLAQPTVAKTGNANTKYRQSPQVNPDYQIRGARRLVAPIRSPIHNSLTLRMLFSTY